MFVCYLTRFATAIPTVDFTSLSTIVCSGLWTEEYGGISRLFLDNVVALKPNLVVVWSTQNRTALFYIGPYCHSSHGLVERVNQTLIERI